MKNYLYNLFFFRIYYNIWLKLLIIISFLYILFLFYKKETQKIQYEGFQQKEKFVLKTNEDAVDDFYSEISDILHKPQRRIQSEISVILQQTMPSKENSIFLTVGSNTGHTVKELNDLGYHAYGIDKSSSLVNHSIELYPDIHVKTGDACVDPMLYEKGVFTHILCLYYTIYSIQDKKAFFENCYFWMKPGAYLILHLVDKEKFDKKVPCARLPMFPNSSPAVGWNTDMKVDFMDFQYKARYQTSVKLDEILFIETFTDTASGNIRQNERILYMEPLETILNLSIRSGFLLHGKYNIPSYHDSNQYIYILERTL